MRFRIRNANVFRLGLLNDFVFVALLLAANAGADADAVDINIAVAADFGCCYLFKRISDYSLLWA